MNTINVRHHADSVLVNLAAQELDVTNALLAIEGLIGDPAEDVDGLHALPRECTFTCSFTCINGYTSM